MSDRPSPSSAFASALIGRLAARGVEHVVVSPGSRSQALALAAGHAALDGRLSVHIKIDERSAGFFALGLARGTGKPVVVVTTSGTAVANLHPAMLEAWHSGDALIVVTADRPAELRGRGANQTTTQPGIFGPAATWQADVPAPTGAPDERRQAVGLADAAYSAAAVGRGHPSPVHLNIAFREPLSGGADAPLGEERIETFDAPRVTATVLTRGPLTIVVAGSGSGSEAERLAADGGWPLVAEVTSGARFGPNLVSAYRRVLDEETLAGRVERAIVFGRPNLSRQVTALLTRSGVETVLVAQRGAEAFDPTGSAGRAQAVEVPGDPSSAEQSWLREWIIAGRRLTEAGDDVAYIGGSGGGSAAERSRLVRAELDAVRAPVTRRTLAEAVWRATWPHDRLWFAASRLVREADAVANGKKIPVYSSRGLAGIDGTVSSALGLAAAAAADPRGATGTTRVLLGDLAFLHDVGGLYIAPGEPRPRIQLIVGNDRGGSIFDGLEVAATAHPDVFDRVMYTPHDVDLASIAAAYGWAHTVVANRGDLDRALTAPPAGPSVLEVPLER